jgi:hypothetical protein
VERRGPSERIEDFLRRHRREVLVVAVMLAAQVWLLRGCFVVVGWSIWWQVGLASLVGTVSVMVWLGFYSGFVRSLKRLLIAALVFVVLSSAMLAAAVSAEVPVAVVC